MMSLALLVVITHVLWKFSADYQSFGIWFSTRYSYNQGAAVTTGGATVTTGGGQSAHPAAGELLAC